MRAVRCNSDGTAATAAADAAVSSRALKDDSVCPAPTIAGFIKKPSS